MKLHSPFEISPRLLPALRISGTQSTAWLSYDSEKSAFVLDLPDGVSEWITGFAPGAGQSLASQFTAILAFLSACAESRSCAEGRGKDAMEGENSDLFSPHVGAWAQSMSGEIDSLRFEIEETDEELIES